MNQEYRSLRSPETTQAENITFIQKMFNVLINNWVFFLACVILALAAGYFYYKYTLPTYRVSTTVLIEEGESQGMAGADQLLQGFGLRPGAQNLDNQIHLLSSFTTIRNTLAELPFDFDCYGKGILKNISYYPRHPFKIMQSSMTEVPRNLEFCLRRIEGNKFRLTTNKKSEFPLDTVIVLGRNIELGNASFSIVPTADYKELYSSHNKIYFAFHNTESLLTSYKRKLKVETASADGTIVRLSLEGTNRAKDIIFLDKLTDVFLTSNLDKKNLEATRVIEFIDEQLVNVSDSLMITENKLQEFRSRNRVMDISQQGQQIIEQATRLEQEKANLKLKANYYGYLTDYLSSENIQETPIAPASMGIDDPLLTNLMQDLSALQAEYFGGTAGDKNPLQGQLELRIKNTKQSLRETLLGIIQGNEMALEENQSQIQELNRRAAGLPKTERQLLGIEREFNLNNVLYTFLLQRRAEAQIQKASNKPDNELVDPARADMLPVSPDLLIVFFIAIFLGLGVPFSVMIISDSFSSKIISETDLSRITNLPIVGHIPHCKLNYQNVVLNDSQSIVSEAFRSFRTRMEFFTKQTKSPIILISSSMPGEGKSFCAVNLASAYSLVKKKTVIVGFDLRRPNLSPDFQASTTKGVSTYLIGKDNLDDVIQNSGRDYLDIIPSGPIPPNPAELAASDKTRELMNKLRDRYDYIIIDTPPIGVVSDGLQLADLADASILVVRHRHTPRHSLEFVLREVDGHGIKGLSILVNDLKSNQGSYRYSYTYKQDYKSKQNGRESRKTSKRGKK